MFAVTQEPIIADSKLDTNNHSNRASLTNSEVRVLYLSTFCEKGPR